MVLPRVGFLVVALVVAVPCRVQAAGLEEWQVGAWAAGSWERREAAGQLGIDAQYGLAVGWSVRGAVDASSKGTFALVGGAVYAIDALQTVPFAELSLVGARVDDGGAAGPELGLGFDRLLNRRWTLGGFMRGRALPFHTTGINMPLIFSVGVRLSHVLF